MRALVTGAAGFVGRWLVTALAARGYDVTGLSTTHPEMDGPPGTPRFPDRLHWQVGDVRDPAHLHAAVFTCRPDLVVHLAAISHVPTAAADPALAWDVNVTATARLLHEVGKLRDGGNADPRVLIVGSAEEYGRHDERDRLAEDAPLRPHTVYAATKVAQEVLAQQAWRASGLRTVCVRSFNHSGPGQEPRFLLPALVHRALALRAAMHTEGRAGVTETAGAAPPVLRLGNLTPVRDFLHVEDVVHAYISLGEDGAPGEAYNVASGVGHSVRDVAARVLDRVGVTAVLEEDPALVRHVDVPSLVGDSRKLQDAVGWRATKSLDDIIDDLVHAATH